MKTTSEVLQDVLLSGSHINKFDFLALTNSVCLAQRILELRQLGWFIRDKAVEGKGNLREYWLDADEIERIKKTPRMVTNSEQNVKDEQSVEPIENIVEEACIRLKNEDIAYEQMSLLPGGENLKKRW